MRGSYHMLADDGSHFDANIPQSTLSVPRTVHWCSNLCHQRHSGPVTTNCSSCCKRFEFDPARDTLWFCGDLVNRGDQSLEVLRLRAFVHGERAITVLGNHDLNLLAVAERDETDQGKVMLLNCARCCSHTIVTCSSTGCAHSLCCTPTMT